MNIKFILEIIHYEMHLGSELFVHRSFSMFFSLFVVVVVSSLVSVICLIFLYQIWSVFSVFLLISYISRDALVKYLKLVEYLFA